MCGYYAIDWSRPIVTQRFRCARAGRFRRRSVWDKYGSHSADTRCWRAWKPDVPRVFAQFLGSQSGHDGGVSLSLKSPELSAVVDQRYEQA